MMKIPTRLFTAVLALGLATAFTASAQSMKIGIVDIGEVVDGYKAAKVREDALNKQGEALATRLKEMQSRGMEMINDLNNVKKEIAEISSDTTLSDEARQAKLQAPSEAYQRKAENVQKFGKQLEDYRNTEAGKLKEAMVELNNEVVLQVAQAVRTYAQQNGYDLVFNQNKKSPASSDIIYAGKGDDLTAKVITYINSLPADPAPAAN